MNADMRAGFAAIIGAPNAGKSTLVNRLVGRKVSIVTHKVQTTRFQVRGVAMRGRSQIVLVDTPGVFAPRRRLEPGSSGEPDALPEPLHGRLWLSRGEATTRLHSPLVRWMHGSAAEPSVQGDAVSLSQHAHRGGHPALLTLAVQVGRHRPGHRPRRVRRSWVLGLG